MGGAGLLYPGRAHHRLHQNEVRKRIRRAARVRNNGYHAARSQEGTQWKRRERSSTEAETGAHLSSGAGPQEWALVGASERRTKYET